MADGSAGPDGDGDGVTGLGAEFVDDTAREDEADTVGHHEALDNVSVVEVVDDLEFG